MSANYLTFQKFNDPGLAGEIAARLKQANIDYQLEDNNKFFDPSFANNSFDPYIHLKVKPEDFSAATAALEDHYKKLVEEVEPDYYLLSFTDEELTEIISKPDEWGQFDYILAQKLLKDRGKTISLERTQILKTQRLQDLSRPETAHKNLVIGGYAAAVLFGFAGLIIGWMLAYMKKTLPNGERVYAYRNEERNHGFLILLLSATSLFLWILARLHLLNSNTLTDV